MSCPPEDHKLTEWRMLAKLSLTGRPIMRLVWTLRRNVGRRDPRQGQAPPSFDTVHCLGFFLTLHSGAMLSGLGRPCSVRWAPTPNLCNGRPAHRGVQPSALLHWPGGRGRLAADPLGFLQLLKSFLCAALCLDAWR